MPVHEKATLLVPSGTYHDPNKKHLHIVCSNPDSAGNVVVVSVTTYTNDLCDQTCVLETHEFSWLRHKSFVLYRKAEIVSAAALQVRIDSGDIIERDEIDVQVFLRIKNGLINSPQTKRKVKRYIQSQA